MIVPKVLFGIQSIFETRYITKVHESRDIVVHNYWGIESHFGVYMLGILLGYLIRRKPDLYFGGRIGELFIWIVSWSMTVWGLLWHRNYYNPDYEFGKYEVLLWQAFSKYFYCAGWFWTIYACTTGRGGLILSFNNQLLK